MFRKTLLTLAVASLLSAASGIALAASDSPIQINSGESATPPNSPGADPRTQGDDQGRSTGTYDKSDQGGSQSGGGDDDDDDDDGGGAADGGSDSSSAPPN
ncbi:hypothetical protein PMM47T1_27349 [Pseudomonas sp. M47T1]|uniref:hypothetical protein n=1 Tax=unclassified Pseudomonas TaxID=196821 RepID=UPI000260811E|nr:hypothetical protein [Pseudomonas sp. M47T1]EIK93388.1 hypothetical protein PMM47T1_27349 [Pseudomonas sp. M47T1]